MSTGAPSVSCPACGASNRASAKFCGGCGGQIAAEVRCGACGTPNPPGRAFCDECGNSLRAGGSGSDVAARRRTDPQAFAAGRYRVLRFLGEGARKRVYLAEDTQLRREVAVAVCKSDGLEASALARARREA